jgi:L-threonylcarbamoyladenylate synthase
MKEDILKAVETLKKGGIILYPTDTVWSLGCDATNSEAIDKLLRIKQLNFNSGFLMLVSDLGMVGRYIKDIPDIAYQLVEYAEKPLSIIYPASRDLATNVVGVDNSAGFRVTKDEFCLKTLGLFRRPIVSTCANFSGAKVPSKFDEVDEGIVNSADYVVNWRQNDLSPAKVSSIIKIELNGEFKFIRK